DPPRGSTPALHRRLHPGGAAGGHGHRRLPGGGDHAGGDRAGALHQRTVRAPGGAGQRARHPGAGGERAARRSAAGRADPRQRGLHPLRRADDLGRVLRGRERLALRHLRQGGLGQRRVVHPQHPLARGADVGAERHRRHRCRFPVRAGGDARRHPERDAGGHVALRPHHQRAHADVGDQDRRGAGGGDAGAGAGRVPVPHGGLRGRRAGDQRRPVDDARERWPARAARRPHRARGLPLPGRHGCRRGGRQPERRAQRARGGGDEGAEDVARGVRDQRRLDHRVAPQLPV
ncbi:MAG: hypothetical protein AVDCRST_MAG68-2246, partial [uncultured Gemmatimonadetes bacterium]